MISNGTRAAGLSGRRGSKVDRQYFTQLLKQLTLNQSYRISLRADC
jgi:hypothetical protein